jgi:hypothetical protein
LEKIKTKKEIKIEDEKRIKDHKEQLLKLKSPKVPFKSVLSPAIRELVAMNDFKAPEDKTKRKLLAELEDKGANKVLIVEALCFPKFLLELKSGMHDMKTYFNEADLQSEKKVKNTFKRLIKLIEGLSPVLPDTLHGQNINKKIARFLVELKGLAKQYEYDLGEYFDLKLSEPYIDRMIENLQKPVGTIIFNLYPPHKIADTFRKKLKLTKHVWNESIFVLVEELRRIGFSWNKSYDKTLELLNLFHHDIYPDADRDLVRQRYSYYKEKLLSSSPPQK